MPTASRRPFGQNYAFVVAGAIFLALMAAAALRAAPGVLILPLEKAFGWSRAETLGRDVFELIIPPDKLPEWAESALNNLTVPPSTIRPVVSTLPNGLTLIVQPEDVSNTVTVYGHIKTRPEMLQPQGKEGVAQILGELFSYGTEHLDRLNQISG